MKTTRKRFHSKRVRASKPHTRARRIALIRPIDLHDPLRIRLKQLALCTALGKYLSIACPDEDTMRVRNLVHRGAPRPVSKYPSFKLGRVVECESLLEVELAMLLDASPGIEAFAEQPVVLSYTEESARRWHVPDFVVLCKGQLHFIEVKFQRDVDEAVLARAERLAIGLGRAGATYAVLTEDEIRAHYWLDNVRQLLRRGRYTLPEIELLGYHERLRREGGRTLGEWGWAQPGSRGAIGIARLILQGKAWVDMSQRLGRASMVRIHEEEVATWPLDRSA